MNFNKIGERISIVIVLLTMCINVFWNLLGQYQFANK